MPHFTDTIPPAGVLNRRQIRELHKAGVLRSPRVPKLDPDVSAVDLRLGSKVWVSPASVKQVHDQGDSVEKSLRALRATRERVPPSGYEIDPAKRYVFVFELQESVDLSSVPWLRARATGKSSIGRLDVLTRLMANDASAYDELPLGYKGPLYLEVIPSTFRLLLRPGDALAQLRFFSGRPEDCRIKDIADRPLLFIKDHENGYRFAFEEQIREHLTVDLEEDPAAGAAAFRAIRTTGSKADPIDWATASSDKRRRLDPTAYFKREPGGADRMLTLKQGDFYILRSRERLALPRDIAVTGYAYTESLGELRIHYAGFAHPYFGLERGDSRSGTPLIFEVRAHSVDVALRHGEVLANINFYRMSEPASKPKPGPYSKQELTLSKVFRTMERAG